MASVDVPETLPIEGAIATSFSLVADGELKFSSERGEFTLSFLPSRAEVITPDLTQQVDEVALRSLLGEVVEHAALQRDGSLVLKLGDRTVAIRPDETVESWELRGPGIFAVSPAGGGSPSVWES